MGAKYRLRSVVILGGIACLVAAGVGCAGAYEGSFQANLRRQAAFDLQCAENQLTITPLSQAQGLTRSAGVTGCGKRASYILIETGAWDRTGEPSAP